MGTVRGLDKADRRGLSWAARLFAMAETGGVGAVARRRFIVAFWAVLPLGLVVAIFVFVLRVGEPLPFPRHRLPAEPYQPDRCTWTCHNHGCRHAPRLPDFLSADDGLFGQTVHGLHWLGRRAMPSRPQQGYGLVNLVLFCLLWPALMWGLYLKALSQTLALRELGRRLRKPGHSGTESASAGGGRDVR